VLTQNLGEMDSILFMVVDTGGLGGWVVGWLVVLLNVPREVISPFNKFVNIVRMKSVAGKFFE